MADKAFTLYWRDGEREVVHGSSVADAMTRAGYGAGALAALDFHASGDCDEYQWEPKANEWRWLKLKDYLPSVEEQA